MNPEWVQQFNIKFISILRNFVLTFNKPRNSNVSRGSTKTCASRHII